MNNIGIPGTVLLLTGLFLIIAIFTSKRTIPFLQSVFSFEWLKKYMKREKNEDREFSDEEETDVEEEAEEVVVRAPVERTEMPLHSEVCREAEAVKTYEQVFDTETEMRKAEEEEERVAEKNRPVEKEMPEKNDFQFEVARGDDPVVEMSDGNRTAFAVEIPEDDENYDQSQLGKYDPRLDL